MISRRYTIYLVVCIFLGASISTHCLEIGLDAGNQDLFIVAPDSLAVGAYSFGAVPDDSSGQYSDGTGMTISAANGQGVRIYGPVVNSGAGLTLVRVSAYCLGEDVALTVAALNAQADGSLQDIDGSIATNQPINGLDFLNRWETLQVLYDPKGDALAPVVQVAGYADTPVTVYMDQLEIIPLANLPRDEVDGLIGLSETGVEPTPTPGDVTNPTPTPTTSGTASEKTYLTEPFKTYIPKPLGYVALSPNISPYSYAAYAIATEDMLEIWRLDTEAPLEKIGASYPPISTFSFSSNGNRIAGINTKGKAYVWDIHSKLLLNKLNTATEKALTVTYALDAESIVTTSDDGMIRVWNPDTGEVMAAFNFTGESPPPCAISSDGTQIAMSGESPSTAQIWSVSPSEFVKNIGVSQDAIQKLAFSQSGDQLSIGTSNSITVLNIDSSEIIHQFPIEGTPLTIAYSLRNNTVAAGTSNGLYVWDLANGSLLLHEYVGLKVSDIAFTTTRMSALINDTRIDVYNATSLKKTDAYFINHGGAVEKVFYVPDGSEIATVIDQEIRFYSRETGDLLRTLSLPLAPSYATLTIDGFSRDGTRLLAHDYNSPLLLDAQTGQVISAFGNSSYLSKSSSTNTLSLNPQSMQCGISIAQAHFSKDENKIITLDEYNYENLIQIWDIELGQKVLGLDYDIQTSATTDLSVANGILAAIQNENIEILDLSDCLNLQQKLLPHLDMPSGTRSALKISPNGTRLLCIDGRTGLELWDLQSAGLINILLETVYRNADIETFEIAGNDSLVVFPMTDKKLGVWNTSKSHIDAEIDTGAKIYDIEISSDGLELLTGHEGGVVLCWSLEDI